MNTNETDPQQVDFAVSSQSIDTPTDAIDTPPQLSAEQVAQFIVDLLGQLTD